MSILNNSLLLGADAGAAGYQISRSIRLNSSDSAFLSRTPASSGNRKTWTWSGWVKRSAIAFSAEQHIWGVTGTTDATYGEMFFGTGDTLRFAVGYNTTYGITTTRVFRDASAWYHIVLAFDATQLTAANKIKLYINGVEETTFSSDTRSSLANQDWGYNNNVAHYIGRQANSDIRHFNGYLADIHFIDGQALTPSSFAETNATTGQWVPKAYSGSYGTNGFRLDFSDNSAATATTLGKDRAGSNNWTPNNLAINNSTLNYSSYWAAGGNNNAAIGANNAFDGNTSTYLRTNNSGNYQIWTPASSIAYTSLRIYVHNIVGSAANTLFVNGVAQTTPTSTGWFTPSGVSSPLTSIEIRETSTTALGIAAVEINNGILLDRSWPGNDSLVDTPTSYGTDTGVGGEVRGNYATLNPLDIRGTSTAFSLSDGNLRLASLAPGGGATGGIASTIGVSSGKWYAEFTLAATSGAWTIIGVYSASSTLYPGYSSNSYGYIQSGNKIVGDSGSSYGSSYTTNDVIGVALDMDAGTLTFYKNGTSQGQAFSGITGTIFFAAGKASSAETNTIHCNFGQRPFAYTAPSGFKALCDTSLPAPTIARPSTVMDVKLYTGSSGSQNITTNFSPDLVWVKTRNATTDHELYDTVRGAGIRLSSNATLAESNLGANGLTSFNSNGFTVPSTANYGINGSGYTYVAWTWDAGSSTVTNTSGSISSQVRANASAGFSIVTYTGNGTVGATVGHGLGVAPAMLIVKRRDAVSAARWAVQHTSLAATQLLALNTTAAAHTESAGAGSTFNVTKAGSSVFTLGDYPDSNANTGTYVAYCFAPVAGYSAFGSYTGNGSTDGPFVFCNFRPRWIVFKQANVGGQGWFILDTVRSTYNVASTYLLAQSANAEASGYVDTDFCSNGFKIRSSDGAVNASGGTYIYAAFAENPFQYARAR